MENNLYHFMRLLHKGGGEIKDEEAEGVGWFVITLAILLIIGMVIGVSVIVGVAVR